MTEPNNMNPGRARKWTRRALLGSGVAVAAVGAAGFGILASRDGAGLVPGRSRARPVQSDNVLPKEVDIVVIGGGNIGCMTALTLAERGHRVALCEKGVVAGEASGRSMGFIDGSFADPAKLPIVNRSKLLWEGMNARLGSETGYRRSGLLALFASDESVQGAAGWLEAMKGIPGVDGRILSATEATHLAPGSADKFAGAYFSASDAMAEPQLYAPAVADAFRRAGGLLFQNCAVRGVETKGGAISAVVTEKGRISCSVLVVAGGAWSPVFARSLGFDLPQFMCFSSCARLAATRAAGPMPCVVSEQHGNLFRRTASGAYDTAIALGTAPVTADVIGNLPRLWPAWKNMKDQLRPAFDLSTFMAQWNIPDRWDLDAPSPFEENRILMPETRRSIVDEAVAATAAGFPAIGKAPVIERWSGALMSTLDNMPVISAVPGRRGLFIGSGFYFGLTMAPGAGEALADLVTGATPKIDLEPYRFNRFSDGSPLEFRA
jgi:glycine/D-amino acid oxidase-like deaminating enzyme